MLKGVRINKYLADQKIAPRREADRLITAGVVKINGKKAVLGQIVIEGDKVEMINHKPSYTYLAYYKGRGIIAHSPEGDEVDVATRLEADYGLKGISPIGRLDKASEGLLILSNDGRITKPLLESGYEHDKEYEVMVDKNVSAFFLKQLENGVNIEGYKTKKSEANAHKNDPKKFFLTLTEGKKHQIRRMCAALGYQVKSLKRVRIMNIKLGSLKPNQYRKIAGAELKEFLQALGL